MQESQAPSISHPSVLVIGAGVSGLACARRLDLAGIDVRLLDKGRGLGGRVATRRRGQLTFDHGAQYFTVRDPLFAATVESWRRDGVARLWEGRIGTLSRGVRGDARSATERWVGVPSMSAIGRRMASGLDVQRGVRVDSLERDPGSWRAVDAHGGEWSANAAVLTVPAPQAAGLLSDSESLIARVAAVEMSPCWTVMATFDEPLPLELDGVFVADSPLVWIARDSSKPGRPAGERWVLQAGPEWSEENLERSADGVVGDLLAALAVAIGDSIATPSFATAHRWRYARAARPLGADYLYDSALQIGVCGDWCPGERIEGAFLSGWALAGRILRTAPGDEVS